MIVQYTCLGQFTCMCFNGTLHRCLTHFWPALSNSVFHVLAQYLTYLNDISIMYNYISPDISPNYVMPADTHRHVIHLKKQFACICMVVCRILDGEYVAIPVESV